MKKILPFFLSLVVMIYNILPTFTIKADSMPTDSQYRMLGSFMLSELIRTGEATELDFSDYDSNNGDLLLALGEAVFTGDFTGLVQIGLDWLDDTVISAYDTFKQGIREWEYSIAPNLYEAWYGSTPFQNALHLSDCIGMAEDLFNLIQPPSNDNPTPSPEPNFDFIQYLGNMYFRDIDWFNSWGLGYGGLMNMRPVNQVSFPFVKNSVSYYYNAGGMQHLPTSDGRTQYDHLSVNNGIITIRYNSTTGIAVYQNNHWLQGVIPGSSADTYDGMRIYQTANGNWWYSNSYNQQNYTLRNTFPDISTFINYVYRSFCNVNLYVDDVPWYLVDTGGVNYPIVIPDQFTIWDGQNLNYQFPDDTYIDLSSLTNIISTAINNSDIVHWSDIESTYVDVNGQQAVAVTNIYRSDDDNLYIEQYPNITLPRFSHNQISVLGNYVEPVTKVVEESTDILPAELVTLFKVAVILMLFACIVHRLLE